MHFCIFSFNRGRFLRNCVASVEYCSPGSEITVFDDGSDDPETQKVLTDLARRHRVRQPGVQSTHRLGGLYGNMQSAFELCGNSETLCFLQDDTQLVRPLMNADLNGIEKSFQDNAGLGFISPCFIRGRSLNRGARFCFDFDQNLYFRNPDKLSSGGHFSALLIAKPDRLRAAGWFFEGSEPRNDVQAERLFGPMGYLYSPFAMWLPEVPAYRGKRKTLGLRLAERKRKCGFYPFRFMEPDEVSEMEHRDPSVLPRAEDFLECTHITPIAPWAYNPLTGTGWVKLLNRIELTVSRLLGRQ